MNTETMETLLDLTETALRLDPEAAHLLRAREALRAALREAGEGWA